MLPKQVESMVAARARSRYWREADARLIVGALSDSGMSMGAFGRHFGINVKRLRRWRRRLAELPAPSTTFHEVRVSEPVRPLAIVVDDAEAGAMFEVILRGERRIRLGASFDDHALAKLIGVLESTPC